MKVLRCLGLAGLVSLFAGAQVFSAETYRALKASSAMVINGKADEACWEKVQALPFNYFYDVEKPGDRQDSTVKILWDDKHLYLFYDCRDRFLTARVKERDGKVFYDDCAEIFLKPTTDIIAMHFVLEFNLYKTANDAVLLNNMYRGHNISVKAYDPDYDAAVQINGTLNDNSDIDDGWTMEIAVPLKGVRVAWGLPPFSPGCRWAFMAVRKDRNELEGERASLSTVFPLKKDEVNVHDPNCFGPIEFVAEPPE